MIDKSAFKKGDVVLLKWASDTGHVHRLECVVDEFDGERLWGFWREPGGRWRKARQNTWYNKRELTLHPNPEPVLAAWIAYIIEKEALNRG